MWLPIWVFDGNGFTMACLAVWIRNVALRWGSSAMTMRSGAVDATASNGSSQRCQDQRLLDRGLLWSVQQHQRRLSIDFRETSYVFELQAAPSQLLDS